MYDNSYLNRIISVLEDAGFLVTGFSHKPWIGHCPMRLEVFPTKKKPQAQVILKTNRHPGEIVNLERYLMAEDWRDALYQIHEMVQDGKTAGFNPGDFILVSFDVPEANHKGVNFEALQIRDAKIQIVEIQNDKIIFNFDEILFLSAINAKDKNEGGFRESALAEYLNTEFLNALDLSEELIPNNDAQKISIPTACELFGNEKYWEATSNFFDKPHQIDFFKSIKNRIKVWEEDTHWYWLASPRASSAAGFCICGTNGRSTSSNASAVGGVAPAFCVA
jgi:hypothetical protein